MIAVKIQNLIVDTAKVFFSIGRLIVLSGKPSKLTIEKKATEAVILANGPSFNETYKKNKSFLKDKECICVNYFPTSPLFEEIKPRYAIITGPPLWQENLGERNTNLTVPLFEALAAKTTWDLIFFIPCDARKWKNWKKIIDTNKHISVYYFNNTPIEGWNWFQTFIFNKRLGMPRPQNILIPSIYMMIQLRYKKVFLWGVDHSWLKEISVNDDNLALVHQKHFYDENETKPFPMGIGEQPKYRMHNILYKFMKTFESYFILREYADKRGVSIINNTEGSYIDAFERMKLKGDEE